MKSRSLTWLVYSMISIGSFYISMFSLTKLMEFLTTFKIVY